MYKPSQQLKTHTPFIGLITAATFTSTGLGQLSGIFYANNQNTHSLLAATASAVPMLFIGFTAINHQTKQPPTTPTPPLPPCSCSQVSAERSDVVDPLEEIWLRPTRRGGSPTVGRESQPEHDIETNARNLLGEQKYIELTSPVSVWQRMKNAVDFLVGQDDPKTLIGPWIAVALIAVAVFA